MASFKKMIKKADPTKVIKKAAREVKRTTSRVGAEIRREGRDIDRFQRNNVIGNTLTPYGWYHGGKNAAESIRGMMNPDMPDMPSMSQPGMLPNAEPRLGGGAAGGGTLLTDSDTGGGTLLSAVNKKYRTR